MNNRTAKRGQRAIVIGGSFAGLMAARVLSDHFERVTLIERDEINDRPEARKGQPQVRHPHTVLANGLNVLTRYFPDLPDALRKGGASITDVGTAIRWHVSGGYRRQFKSGVYFALASRPFLEWEVRRRVLSCPTSPRWTDPRSRRCFRAAKAAASPGSGPSAGTGTAARRSPNW